MPRQQHYPRSLFYTWATISALMIITGCVSQSKFDQLALDHESTVKERDTLAENNQTLNSQIDQLTTEKTKLNKELNHINQTLTQKKQELTTLNEKFSLSSQKLNDIDEQLINANSELAATQQRLSLTHSQLEDKDMQLLKTKQEAEENSHLYDGLVKNLTSELSDNKIKIQEMKNGINVELSQDILFPAGFAKLNETGNSVIIKVSEILKDIPHNIVVAGFTDNVPISGGLANKYPTNWELAGARASSVVRLLENNGVDPNKLAAISYGATQPIGNNDTDEGRAQNRRIEIRLRPNK